MKQATLAPEDNNDSDASGSSHQALVVRDPAAALAAITEKPPVTAAQAKVDAVASLTMSAYSKASELHLTPEETVALQAEFPDDAFQPGAAGKEHLIYIEHAHLRDRFNSVFGMGQWAIVPRNRWAEDFKTGKGVEGSRVYVEAMLLVRGCFVGEAVGAMEYYPSNNSQNYGDAVEGAKTAALRRCAKELGVGLQAWKKEFCEGWWKRRNARPKGAIPRQQNNLGVSGSAEATRNTRSRTGASEGETGGRTPSPTAGQSTKPAGPTDTVKPSKQAEYATKESRMRFLNQLNASPGQEGAAMVMGFCVEAGILLPFEQLVDMPLEYVPVTKKQMDLWIAAIQDWESNGEAEKPFVNALAPEADGSGTAPPRGDQRTSTQTASASTPTPARGSVEKPKRPSYENKKDETWWFDVPIHIPRKSMKFAEYALNQDTIGSLYERRHDKSEEGQYLRKRLFGIVQNFTGGWTKRDGTKVPPNEDDKALREALDAFAEYVNKNGERI